MVETQPPHGVPALLDHLPHQLKDAAERRFGRRILGQPVDRDVQLHGCAEKALQQGIVQFLRDASPLGQPLFKTNVELPSEADAAGNDKER